jgi:hypothetical protein
VLKTKRLQFVTAAESESIQTRQPLQIQTP